jgi:hypothetical protein
MMALHTFVNVATLLLLTTLAKAFTVTPTSSRNVNTCLQARDPKQNIEDRRIERENEILDIGGDPFFLSDDDVLDEPAEEEEQDAMMSGALHNQKEEEVVKEESFLWDGEVDETAYFD